MANKVYSADEEEFVDYDTALFRATADPEIKPGDTVTLVEGDEVPADHSQFVNGDRLIEELQERAYDEYGEYAEDYLVDVGDVAELEALIVGWLNEHAKPPTFYRVDNMREISVTVGEI